jgi:hypothetical protein
VEEGCGMWKRAVECGRGLWKRAVECGMWNVECGLWKRASGRTRGVVVGTCMRVTEEQKRGSVAYTSGSEITSRSIACTRSPRACSMASSAPSPHLPTGEKRRGEHLHARLQHGLEHAVAASYADDRAVTCGWAPGEHLHAHPMRTTSRWRAEGRGRRGEHLHAHPMLTTSRCRASKTLASTSACVGVGHAHVPKGGGGAPW